MTHHRIALLSSRTLVAEGIAASLRRRPDAWIIETMDAYEPDLLGQIVAFQPKIVIVDAGDDEVNRRYPLEYLLRTLPGLTIIRVDPLHDQLQVVTSQQRTARSMGEMVGVITSLTWSDPQEDAL